MKLNEFIQKYPNKMFIRFFYDIEYDYFITKHVCVYVKYQKDKFQESVEHFKLLFNVWSAGARDNKQKIIGYDKIFTSKQLLKQLKNCENFNVQNENGNYYFIEII